MNATRFSCTLPNGETATRTSSSLPYTHAVVSQSGVVSWHTRHDLALRALPSVWGDARSIVPVTAEVIVKVKTSAADLNATRRGVITRQIARFQRSVAHYEGALAEWNAGRGEQTLARLIRDFGAELGAQLHAHRAAEFPNDIARAKAAITKLEGERAALLATNPAKEG